MLLAELSPYRRELFSGACNSAFVHVRRFIHAMTYSQGSLRIPVRRIYAACQQISFRCNVPLHVVNNVHNWGA